MQAIDTLNVDGSSIVDLAGISSFTNLKGLNCHNNLIESLDVTSISGLKRLSCSNNALASMNTSGLSNLNYLSCSNNQLTTLNLSGLSSLLFLGCEQNQLTTLLNLADLTNLQTLICHNNTLGTLDATGLISLQYLDCSGAFLNTLNVSGLTNLQELHCEYNDLVTLNLSNLIGLKKADCYFNDLTSVNLSGLINLTDFNCNGNLLQTIDFSGLSSLKELVCSSNQLTSLNLTGLSSILEIIAAYNQLSTIDVSGLTTLTYLNCSNNNFTTLDITNLPNLQYVYCSNNQISTLDFSNHPLLVGLVCSNNLFTSLDFSANPMFIFLQCDNNLLTFLNIKNGRNQNYFETDSWANNPDLMYVCVDESEINPIQIPLSQTGSTNVVMNTYCSYTPGGNYNTIRGTITFDADNNGCDTSDSVKPNVKVKLISPTEIGYSFSNTAGLYAFFVGVNGFSWGLDVENPTFFNVSPISGNTSFIDLNNNVAVQDFCVTANGVHPDLEIVIAPITPARPGFDAVYKIVYRNKGNQTMSQLNGISFSFDNNVMSYVSSSDVTSSVLPGTLTWDFTNLSPFESRAIVVTMHVNSPTDPNFPVNIGDILTLTATVNPIAADENPSDNTFQFNQTVVGSFDPNDITCIEGNMVSPSEIGNYLHYIINFENTGTADDENIVVKDIIDTTQFDVNSLQILNSSAPVTAKLTGNVAEFIFQDINLHSGGHGNILIKIKSKNTLVQGDSVNKRANIYFDYNAPVDTNLENTIFQALSNPDYETDASISVYPNPSKGNVNINCNNTIKSVQLFDVQGRLLETDLINQTSAVIDISGKSNGVYFLKIISDKGIKVEKIVRE